MGAFIGAQVSQVSEAGGEAKAVNRTTGVDSHRHRFPPSVFQVFRSDLGKTKKKKKGRAVVLHVEGDNPFVTVQAV